MRRTFRRTRCISTSPWKVPAMCSFGGGSHICIGRAARADRGPTRLPEYCSNAIGHSSGGLAELIWVHLRSFACGKLVVEVESPLEGAHPHRAEVEGRALQRRYSKRLRLSRCLRFADAPRRPKAGDLSGHPRTRCRSGCRAGPWPGLSRSSHAPRPYILITDMHGCNRHSRARSAGNLAENSWRPL